MDKIVYTPSLISLDDCNVSGLCEKLEKNGFDPLKVTNYIHQEMMNMAAAKMELLRRNE